MTLSDIHSEWRVKIQETFGNFGAKSEGQLPAPRSPGCPLEQSRKGGFRHSPAVRTRINYLPTPSFVQRRAFQNGTYATAGSLCPQKCRRSIQLRLVNQL